VHKIIGGEKLGNGNESAIDPKRARALNLAFEATRLLDEAYYDDFSKAVKTNDKDLFVATCNNARVSPDLVDILWEGVRSASQVRALGGW
jgi:hypothetical protein